MKEIYLVFFKMIEEVVINTNLRVSVWSESNPDYLMPCQFIEVIKEVNFYTIKVQVLDPNGFLKNEHLEKKFFLGHPGKIIGYGILKEIKK